MPINRPTLTQRLDRYGIKRNQDPAPTCPAPTAGAPPSAASPLAAAGAAHSADPAVDLPINRPPLTQRLNRYGVKRATSSGQRFSPDHQLGAGSAGIVMSMRDRNLARSVAVKYMPGQLSNIASADIEDFISEGQIIASLQHPNILPVCDLDVDDEGRIYYMMKEVDGHSLGSVIQLSKPGARAAEIADINSVLHIFLSIARAIAYAHSKGVIHQDIKPENIILGKFGEILLIDWGSAFRVSDVKEKSPQGTPLYMSPEQARLQQADARSDIYCLGATLFHALALRPPTWSDDPTTFEEMKKEGTVIGFSKDELRFIPKDLAAITLKAIASAPEARYPTADDLVRDLENVQAGLAVSARPAGPIESVARAFRRHRKAILAVSIPALVITLLLAALMGERIKELANWGMPIATAIEEGQLRADWHVLSGDFDLKDGKLVSQADNMSLLLYDKKLWGDAAIECDATMLPGGPPCDLSIMFARTATFDDKGRGGAKDYYQLKFGAFDGAYACIMGPKDQYLAYSAKRPELGRTYHLRAEVAWDTITMYIDGERILTYRHDVPLSGGYLGVFGYYKGKQFENIRIYSHSVPQKVPALAIGDSYYENGLFEQAGEQYQKLMNSHPGSDLGACAAYKRGLCLAALDKHEEASAQWAQIAGTAYEPLAHLQEVNHLFAQNDHDGVIAGMKNVAKFWRSQEAQQQMPVLWATYVKDLMSRSTESPQTIAKYLKLHDDSLKDYHSADFQAAEALIYLGRFDEVLSLYPLQEPVCCSALIYQGRPEDVPKLYPRQRAKAADALFTMGLSEQVDQLYPEVTWIRLRGLIARGKADQVEKVFPDATWGKAEAAVVLGRLDDIEWMKDQGIGYVTALLFNGKVKEIPKEQPGYEDFTCMMVEGHPQEALEKHPYDFTRALWARHYLGLREFIAGDQAQAFASFELPIGSEFHQEHFAFTHYVMVPMLHQLGGQKNRLAEACRQVVETRRYAYEQKPWHYAMYLLGSMDDTAFLAQPHCVYASADLVLCKGVRADSAGDSELALASYRDYLQIPLYRRAKTIDPVINTFVEWRVKSLSEPQPR